MNRYTLPHVPPVRQLTRAQIALRAALVVALYLAASTLDTQDRFRAADLEPALCSTDTDCAAHCPPPADDPDCDGGPELVSI